MNGKICLITGANSGLGKATALNFAEQGATVIMLCRDRARGENAAADIKSAAPKASLEVVVADLGVQSSVRQAVSLIQVKYDHIDVLVNSAGVYTAQRTLTPDGLETMFATNHLGHFLLTNLLLDQLKASAGGRVIHVTAPTTTPLDFDDLQGEKHFSANHAFGASKMCNLLFSYALAKRLAGTAVTSNALHPGLMKSALMREAPAALRFILNVISRSPEQAASKVAYLAFSSEVVGVSGGFFIGNKARQPDAYALSAENQDRLWRGGGHFSGRPAVLGRP